MNRAKIQIRNIKKYFEIGCDQSELKFSDFHEFRVMRLQSPFKLIYVNGLGILMQFLCIRPVIK